MNETSNFYSDGSYSNSPPPQNVPLPSWVNVNNSKKTVSAPVTPTKMKKASHENFENGTNKKGFYSHKHDRKKKSYYRYHYQNHHQQRNDRKVQASLKCPT